MIESLVEEFGDRIYRFVRRLVGSAWAEDLTQETFLKALKSIDGYRGGRRDAWIFSIANGLCVDFLRRKKLEGRKLREFAGGPAPSDEPPEALARSEEREELMRAIAGLSVEQRQVLLLREEAHMTFREIGEMLECPLGTVLARMHYAVEHLKKKLNLEEPAHELSRIF